MPAFSNIVGKPFNLFNNMYNVYTSAILITYNQMRAIIIIPSLQLPNDHTLPTKSQPGLLFEDAIVKISRIGNKNIVPQKYRQ